MDKSPGLVDGEEILSRRITEPPELIEIAHRADDDAVATFTDDFNRALRSRMGLMTTRRRPRYPGRLHRDVAIPFGLMMNPA
ncbi:hypothetical protein ACIP96_35305 [Streptomyces nigra]|uniref:hypothetical protein n=1 Tax=Streptomyces nigra TaxID=1827580 RepID=UPI0037F97B49